MFEVTDMRTFEFFVRFVDGETGVFSVDTDADWNSARTMADEDSAVAEVIRSIGSIDWQPQKAMAF